MEIAHHLKKHFRPIQPTITETVGEVLYTEILPATHIQNMIYCYWQLKTTQPLSEPFIYRVVADGCIDIFFELSKPQDNFVMGFCKKFTEFPLENSFNYIGIRFFPTMFPQLFKINARDLSNRFEHLKNIIPSTSLYIANHFSPNQNLTEAKTIFDNYFIELIQKSSFNYDTRLYNAIEIILNHCGVIDIEKDLDTGISPRQLRRLFEYYIGDTAKTFSQVVRFQNILKAKPSSQSLRQNKMFYENGYYDQAHFIKEFKNFYGVTPSKAFGR